MSKNVIHSGQSFFNKVLETTGDIDNCFQMMLLNNLTSFTEVLEVGASLKSSSVTNRFVADYFDDSNRPGTAIIIKELPEFEYMFPLEFPFSF